MSEDQNGYYGYEDKVNDAISIGNFLWLATSKGVVKINQTTRKRTEYKEDSIPSNEVESIAANKKRDIWIGTYGKRMAFMDKDSDKWVDVPYDLNLFKHIEGTVEKDGKVLLGGKEEDWLRTNYIHFDANDTLWVGTSIGLLKLQYEEGKPTWDGPFNPNAGTEGPFNVLFIGDVEGGIEISGNYGKRGYEKPVEGIKIYRLPSTISAEDTNWRAMSQEVVVEEIITEVEETATAS